MRRPGIEPGSIAWKAATDACYRLSFLELFIGILNFNKTCQTLECDSKAILQSKYMKSLSNAL